MSEFKIAGLAGEEAGEGVPVVLLHGLTATRRYVVMGSKNLERGGHRVVMYDARGHGRSDPADAYGYGELAADVLAVLDDRGIDRVVLAGASMGAHTIALRARASGARGGAGPDHAGLRPGGGRARAERWDALSAGLRREGWRGSSRPTASRACRSRSARP